VFEYKVRYGRYGLDKWVYQRSNIGAKEVKPHKEILLFCDLNSNYSGIDLKLWNIKENNIFFDIPKLKNSQASQLLVHATASRTINIIKEKKGIQFLMKKLRGILFKKKNKY
jgi:hypothetical protein